MTNYSINLVDDTPVSMAENDQKPGEGVYTQQYVFMQVSETGINNTLSWIEHNWNIPVNAFIHQKVLFRAKNTLIPVQTTVRTSPYLK